MKKDNTIPTLEYYTVCEIAIKCWSSFFLNSNESQGKFCLEKSQIWVEKRVKTAARSCEELWKKQHSNLHTGSESSSARPLLRAQTGGSHRDNMSMAKRSISRVQSSFPAQRAAAKQHRDLLFLFWGTMSSLKEQTDYHRDSIEGPKRKRVWGTRQLPAGTDKASVAHLANPLLTAASVSVFGLSYSL